ncbi:carbonyl reductase [Catellatospora sp. TT07R-123]|uniref:SDR family oxidoreductase n=1 Tax=Catellatospora sp. TT07R-123 TaxID=2733863 RepID=UPI001B066FFB|nr:SDR family oxidoreductase [Catellatospora sp. TT07R-123]GHJ46673.1 carbonyl reductase [Catellatospora sp. TT07R-123]
MTKTALITGANKGIGYEIARGLAAHGFTVLVAARSAERGTAAAAALRTEGHRADFVQLDVTDPESIAAAAARIDAEYGRLDVLVNNAGIARYDGTALPSEATVATLREVYETNLFGVVAVTNAMLPLLRRADDARIINMSSDLGSISLAMDPESPYYKLAFLAYASSKSALNMATACYAKELRDSGISVNAVNPGFTATDLNNNSGTRTREEGARIAVAVATQDSPPTGAFLQDDGPLPW